MSLNNVPSKAEVMGWNPQSLAEYMRKFKLTGCDKVVMKSSITGAKFTQMTERDLQVFPSLYVPKVTKMQSEINKGGRKKLFGLKPKEQKYPKQVFVQEEEIWDSDEFDYESDRDDEGPYREEREDGYIRVLAESQTAGQQNSDENSDEDYEQPSSEYPVKPPRPSREAELQDGHSRDPVYDPTPAERISKPHLPPPRMHHTPRPYKAPASEPNLHIDRSKKPGQSGPSKKDRPKSKGIVSVKAPSSSTSKIPQPRAPKSTDVPNREGKCIPVPPLPTQPAMVNNPTPGPRKCMQGLDPSWYGGKVTRHQAEVILREVDKDGAFVVRDSSRGEVEHPYTLMLLKQGKVYNIKIRNQGNSYSLGTGLNNTMCFPGVKEMITHHAYTPLLLIDATDQSPEAQSYCRLLHPAGL